VGFAEVPAVPGFAGVAFPGELKEVPRIVLEVQGKKAPAGARPGVEVVGVAKESSATLTELLRVIKSSSKSKMSKECQDFSVRTPSSRVTNAFAVETLDSNLVRSMGRAVEVQAR
jgi:hypothetical protein